MSDIFRRFALIPIIALTASCAGQRPAEPLTCALAGASVGVIGGAGVGELDGDDGEDIMAAAGIGAAAGALVGYTVCALMDEKAPPPPPPPPAPVRKPQDLSKPADTFKKRIVLRGANFAHDSDKLTPAAQAILGADIEGLRADTSLRIRIEGHTDSQGAAAYNQKLSERRANSVKSYFTSKGIAASRLTTIGFGEEYPVAGNDTAEGRAKNRRAEVKIIE